MVMAMAMAVVMAGIKGHSKGCGRPLKAGLYNTYITATSFPYITETLFHRVRFNIFSWWPIRSLEKKNRASVSRNNIG